MNVTHVSPKGAIQSVVEGCGKNRRVVSIELGFTERMLSHYVNAGKTPGLALMSRIADACGYTLQLVKGDDVIVIDPPEE